MYKRPMAQFNLSAFELLSEIIEFEGDMVGTEHFDEDHGEFDQKNNLDYFSCIINTKTFILEFLESQCYYCWYHVQPNQAHFFSYN